MRLELRAVLDAMQLELGTNAQPRPEPSAGLIILCIAKVVRQALKIEIDVSTLEVRQTLWDALRRRRYTLGCGGSIPRISGETSVLKCFLALSVSLIWA